MHRRDFVRLSSATLVAAAATSFVPGAIGTLQGASGPNPLLSVGFALAANVVAGMATGFTIELMSAVSPFAVQVRAHDTAMLNPWRTVVYPLCIGAIFAYLWPLIAYFRCGRAGEPSLGVQRRAINGPFVIALAGFFGWLSGIVLFPIVTIVHFGHWDTDLASQQVVSPLVVASRSDHPPR